jgi:hypothetical protein
MSGQNCLVRRTALLVHFTSVRINFNVELSLPTTDAFMHVYNQAQTSESHHIRKLETTHG